MLLAYEIKGINKKLSVKVGEKTNDPLPPISVITGVNGCGKSISAIILSSLFGGDLKALDNITFKKATVYFRTEVPKAKVNLDETTKKTKTPLIKVEVTQHKEDDHMRYDYHIVCRSRKINDNWSFVSEFDNELMEVYHIQKIRYFNPLLLMHKTDFDRDAITASQFYRSITDEEHNIGQDKSFSNTILKELAVTIIDAKFNNDILIIDEPEIGQHICRCEKFIDAMEDEGATDCIIITHSPYIVMSHNDKVRPFVFSYVGNKKVLYTYRDI